MLRPDPVDLGLLPQVAGISGASVGGPSIFRGLTHMRLQQEFRQALAQPETGARDCVSPAHFPRSQRRDRTAVATSGKNLLVRKEVVLIQVAVQLAGNLLQALVIRRLA